MFGAKSMCARIHFSEISGPLFTVMPILRSTDLMNARIFIKQNKHFADDLFFLRSCICFVIQVGCFELFRGGPIRKEITKCAICFVHIFLEHAIFIKHTLLMNKYMSSCKQDHDIRLIA